jgi:hypothetical protein
MPYIKHHVLWMVLAFIASVLILAGASIGVWRAIFAPSVVLRDRLTPVPNMHQTPHYDLGSKAQFLIIDSPLPGDKLMSPLTITGRARLWYFEGSFPIELQDANGAILATGVATAQGDWMTQEFVPFTARLNFFKPSTVKGNLVFKKDNPSGLPENDDQAIVPVVFKLSDPSW